MSARGPTAEELAVELWQRMEARDWAGVAARLAPEFVAEWPQSGERFDRDGFLEVNRRYPGDWHIELVHVVASGEEAVTEVAVSIDGRVDRAVSFLRTSGGRITRIREFWPDPMDVPEWRLALGLAHD